jgi:hypothetical protein
MLFLVRPNLTLRWIELPASLLRDLQQQGGIDLADLSWQDSEGPLTTEAVRVALRHGVPCSVGIVVEAIYIIELGRADEIRETHARAQAAQDELRASPSGELMEAIAPGWGEQGRQLDERIAASAADVIAEAEEDAAQLLAAPVKAELLEHWRRIGGPVPDPA